MTASDSPTSPPVRAPRVGLEEVAHEAGVSLATASRALSGSSVRPVLQERVEQAARRLGYRPDLAAQAVARGATKTVALIVDYLRSPFGVEITRGVVDEASRHGLVVNVTGSETHPGDLLEMIASARAFRPTSLVLATGRVQDPGIRDELVRALDAYQASGGSVAIVDGLDLPFASCSFDEETAAHALARTLADLGYRHPLVFNSSAERADLSGRTLALIEGFVRAGLSRADVIVQESTTEVSGAAPDSDLLDLGGCDVVLCVEGAVLPAVYRHIRARGLRVGADVAVTAFGQYGIGGALRPHLTTVELPLRRAGELALQHALTDTDGAHLSLPGNLRIRASSPRRLPRDVDAPSLRRTPAAHTIATLGVVVSAPLTPPIARAVQASLDLARRDARAGIVMTATSLNEEIASPLDGCDALLVWGPLDTATAERVARAELPCVVVDFPTSQPVGQVTVESAEGMQRLLEHLYAQGHRRFVYLAGMEEDPLEHQRRWGIELFGATHGGVTVDDVPAAPGWEAALDARRAEGATAVLAHDDDRAAEVLRHLTAVGVTVPSEMSVAGFGGGRLGEFTTPSLSTVHLDVESAARAAWHLLTTGDLAGEARSLRAALELRESTGPARGA